MRILPQSASVSYSMSPSLLALPAPVPLSMLPAPQLAGLLPAPQRPPKVEVIIERRQPKSRVFRSLAEWNRADEELTEMFEAAMQRINTAFQGVHHA